jgi:hypothetical protein
LFFESLLTIDKGLVAFPCYIHTLDILMVSKINIIGVITKNPSTTPMAVIVIFCYPNI